MVTRSEGDAACAPACDVNRRTKMRTDMIPPGRPSRPKDMPMRTDGEDKRAREALLVPPRRRFGRRWDVGRSSDLRAVAYAVPTSVASRLAGASAVDAFVPDYRCGAVPDSNRVPSCDAWNAGEPTQCTALYECRVRDVKTERDGRR